jgi:hypothetical protein
MPKDVNKAGNEGGSVTVGLPKHGETMSEPNPTQYWEKMYTDLLKRSDIMFKRNAKLVAALRTAIAYCDNAIHPTEQYHDERQSLIELIQQSVAALEAAKYVLEDQEGWAESDLKIQINKALAQQSTEKP